MKQLIGYLNIQTVELGEAEVVEAEPTDTFDDGWDGCRFVDVDRLVLAEGASREEVAEYVEAASNRLGEEVAVFTVRCPEIEGKYIDISDIDFVD